MKRTAKERLSNARTALVLDHPFFARLALELKFKEDDGSTTETLATDGAFIYYHPPYVETCSDDELVGLVAHEALHCGMQHHTRQGARKAERWNAAADYAINPIITGAGMALPQGGLLNPAWNGKAAEEIYDLLPPSQPNGSGGGQGQQSGGGSGVKKMPGAVLPAKDPAQSAADWQVAMKQAAQVAKMMGRLPGGAEGLVDQATKPITDWRSILHRFVQETAAADYSWKLPNRRYIASGLYLPALKSEAMPPLVVFADTSGSCVAEFPKFIGHIAAIADDCLPERVYVIQADAAVQRVDVFERGELVSSLPIKGYGGTSFAPAFDYLEEEGIEPACAIYLTDLEGDFGKYATSPPDYPVLWATVGSEQAPFGEVVKIED